MGWDISYHPISEKQIKNWYFDVLENPNLINELAHDHAIEDFYKGKYFETMEVALKTAPNSIFETSHGYYVAVVQGFFQKFFYVRGGALSFSESGLLKGYFRPWEDFISADQLKGAVHNTIVNNYSSGVYIPKEKVVQLLDDYSQNEQIYKELNSLFSHNRITVFLKALNFAKERELGLLEATEVIEPNPLDLNNSTCYSNLFNCDPNGALLYQETAMQQFADFEKEKGLEPGAISSNAKYEVKNYDSGEKEKKKSFWKRLFGNK